MRPQSIPGLAAATVASALLFQSLGASPSLGGDEPNRLGLGRLFRMGSPAASPTSNAVQPAVGSPSTPSTTPAYYGQPALSTPPSTIAGASNAPAIKPKPRTHKPATEADPLVTRISLGRSNEGGQFGMLLQVFADGTVIDGEGVHKLGPDALKPVIEAVGSGELGKLKGHCGGPAGDFIETVHVVVFDRAFGKLRANAFSYSGSTQGCDHAVHHLQKVLDEVQAKVSAPASSLAPATAANVPATAPAIGANLAMPALPATSTP